MFSNNIKKVIIVTSEAFPHGMAGTNRIINLCKGFQANDINASVLSFFKFGEPADVYLNPKEGIYEGIVFKNVFNSTIKNRYRFLRGLHELLKAPLVFIYGLKRINKFTLVIYYSHETASAIAVRLLTCLKRSMLIKDETEHPLIRVKRTPKILKFLYLRYHYTLFDGLTVITQNLYDYFRTVVKVKKPVIIVPMIVDVERFSDNLNRPDDTIVFSGALDDQKEGVSNLIKAFSIVVRKHKELTLDLYGKPSNPIQEAQYITLISALGISDKVRFFGYKTRDEMTHIYSKGKIFAFTRPPSLQATYGFSTKLGEYLATGRPVVVTKSGEIEKYLQDHKNAYLCEPNPESIAEKLCEILDNYALALTVGNEGRSCALKYFNNVFETKKMTDQIINNFNKDG